MKKELLRAEAVSYEIDEAPILNDMWVNINAGEITGMLGLRGSGRSTFTKILAGILPNKKGKIFLKGNRLSSEEHNDKLREHVMYLGGSFITFDELTIAENMSIMLKNKKFFHLFNSKAMFDTCEKMLLEIGLDVSPTTKMTKLSEYERALLEMFSAIYCGRKIIICDAAFRNNLLVIPHYRDIILNKLHETGTAMLTISDNIDLLMAICDTITVVNQGYTIRRIEKKDFSPDTIVKYMLNAGVREEPVITKHPRKKEIQDTAVLECKNLVLPVKNIKRSLSFQVKKGEIVGLCSLSTEVNRYITEVLAGRDREYSGEIYRNGHLVTQKHLKQQCCEKNKMCVVFGNNEENMLFSNLTLEENCVLSSLKRISGPFGHIDNSVYNFAKIRLRERNIYTSKKPAKHIEKLDFNERLTILFDRISIFNPELLVYLNPTDEIDINLTDYVFNHCIGLANQSTGILFVSHDINAIHKICDRIAVISWEGEIRKMNINTEQDLSSYQIWQDLI